MGKAAYDNSGTYHVMAQFYDKLMGDTKYSGWKSLITEVLDKYEVSKGLCLDLACGTGNISSILVELGFKVIGVDISSEMLAIAKKKLPTEKFICADSRNFDLGSNQGSVNLVVSFYDSLNYLLSDEDMLRAFKSVNSSVKPGAIFLFDMNSRKHVEVAQGFKPQVFEDEDVRSIFHFGGEDRFWTLDIDLFIKEADGHYRLVREKHVERGYNEADILPILEQTGFQLLETKREYKINENNQKYLARLYFIAKKN